MQKHQINIFISICLLLDTVAISNVNCNHGNENGCCGRAIPHWHTLMYIIIDSGLIRSSNIMGVAHYDMQLELQIPRIFHIKHMSQLCTCRLQIALKPGQALQP